IARTIRTTWSDDDIDFLIRYVQTEAGKQVLEFIDTLTVASLRTSLAKNPQTPAAFEVRTADIAARATQHLGAITANISRVLESAKQDTERAMALVKDVDSRSGELVGQLWVGKLFVVLVSIANTERIEIRSIIDDFRRDEGLPATPPPDAQPSKPESQ